MNPVAFIDDDPMKAHRWILGVPVRGAWIADATMRRYSLDGSSSAALINGHVEHRIRGCAQISIVPRRLQMSIQ